jgi:hypothetical protein
LYKKIFEYLNIPLTIYKDESITDSIDIAIIKNIFNLILNKTINQSFKYSFISILRSYLFNEDDNEIFNYFLNNNFKESELFKLINTIEYNSLTPKELLLKIIEPPTPNPKRSHTETCTGGSQHHLTRRI